MGRRRQKKMGREPEKIGQKTDKKGRKITLDRTERSMADI